MDLDEYQKAFPTLRGRTQADAVVIGGGMSGVTIALWLCKAGLRVHLLEAKTLMSGISRACAGMVSIQNQLCLAEIQKNHGDEALASYVYTQLSALLAVKTVASADGTQCAWKDETLSLLANNDRMVRALEREAKAMQAAGLKAFYGVASHSPWNARQGIKISGMGSVDPLAYQRALIKQAIQTGVQIHEHSRVLQVKENGVSTEGGSIMAPYIVVATGYPIVNIPGWYFLRMQQKRAYQLSFETAMHYEGMLIDLQQRAVLQPQKRGALCYLEGRGVGQKEKQLPLEWLQTQSELMENNRLQSVTSGIETCSADGLPYMGVYSKKTPNLFVATAYAGLGITGSMLASQAISARILGVQTDRYHLYQGNRKGKQTRRKQLSMSTASAIHYVQGLGRIHAPRCSHMGCKMRFHSATRLWECPCHGACFDEIGHVQNAPALHDTHVHEK